MVIIFWRGAGILGLVIPVVLYFVVAFISSRVSDRPMEELEKTKNTYVIAEIISAAILWPLGTWLNRKSVDTPFDPETGRPATGGWNHTLFFIPLQYWSIIWVVVAIFKM